MRRRIFADSFVITAATAALVLGGSLLSAAHAGVAPSTNAHVVDGIFTTPLEWTGPTVSQAFFPQVGNAGGAFLYVDQGFSSNTLPPGFSPDTLFLMYDFVASPPASTAANSFFDVFFEVPQEGDAYLTRILPGTDSFLAFERPIGSNPPLLPDGTFDISPGSGWVALDAGDLALAKFHTAIGFGPSPGNAAPHLMAEFSLSVDNAGQPDRTGGEGFYDPAPAFWSASADKSGPGGDPPISSAIFQLNPNGTTGVAPVLGPGGGPVKVGSAVTVPEPATATFLAVGLLPVGGAVIRRRRKA